MSTNSNSKEYKELVQISELLHEEYNNEHSAWKDSPFGWIKKHPSRTIGAIGEKIIASWLAMHDFNVSRSPDSEADRIVEDKRVEIKFSTLWENGNYKFQQIRDQHYDFIIMLGVSPHDAHCWVLEKQDVIRLWKKEHIISSQHGGIVGSDTAWINLSPYDSSVFSEYGPSLKGALEKIAELTGYTPRSLYFCLEEEEN